jgi:hypothetical protein
MGERSPEAEGQASGITLRGLAMQGAASFSLRSGRELDGNPDAMQIKKDLQRQGIGDIRGG